MEGAAEVTGGERNCFDDRVGGALSRRVPPVAALLQRPTSLLLHALVAVADVSSRVPFAIDATSVWLLVALGCVVAAVVRARRLRGDAPPLPAR